MKRARKSYTIAKKIKSKKAIPYLLLLFVLSLSIAYSAFGTELNIGKFISDIRLEKDIRITGVNINADTSTGSSTYLDYNVSSISTGINLPYEHSSITYNVEITNIEAIEMGILEITGLPDNLEYELGNYRLEEKICNDSKKCNLGITKEIQVTIKYKQGGYDSQNTAFNLNLQFNFQPFYDVKYTNMIFDLVYNAGDVLTYGTESFYVMEDLGDTIKLLSANNITLSTTNPRQSSDLNPTFFSPSAYWWDSENSAYTEEFSNDEKNRPFVYDSRSNIYQYVEAYKQVLEGMRLNVIEARLINFAETRAFGCVGGSCKNAPDWIRTSTYWVGAAQDNGVLYIGKSGDHYSTTGVSDSTKFGIRPVIVIEKKLDLPYEVMANSTFEINLGQNAPDNIIVKMDDIEITDYTYENQVLTIPNVSGNIEIINSYVLPEEYQEVEYIQSHGEEYIDTMFTPNQDTRVIVDFQYTTIKNSFLFGSRTSTLSNSFAVNIGNNAESAYTSFGKSGNAEYALPDTERHVINKNKNVFYLDGEWIVTQTNSTFTAPGSLEIFAAYDHSNGAGYLPSEAKIYSFKIYDDGVLVRDFVPCYRKSDGEIGLFDIVNNEFYANAGSGSFEKGSDAN